MPVPDPYQVLHGATATAAAGRELAPGFRGGDVVLVRGEVGAGKSTLIRAVLRALGVEGPIPSPTFTLGRSYEVTGGHPSLSLACHLDLHRLGPAENEDPGLLAEYFGPDRVTLVEWPEGMADYLSGHAGRLLEIRLAHRDERSRGLGPLVVLSGPADRPRP